METIGKSINFLGDSITEGCGTSSIEERFTSLIEKTGAFSTVRNYGIGGTRIAPQRNRSEDAQWDRDFLGRYADMEEADIIVIFGGTNDFGTGDAPFGEFEDKTPETFCGACNALFLGLRKKFPNAELLVVTPLHRDNENHPCGDGYKPPSKILLEYVKAIEYTAAKHNIPVLSLFDTEKKPVMQKLMPEMFPDGLHPDDRGHAVLAELIMQFIESNCRI